MLVGQHHADHELPGLAGPVPDWGRWRDVHFRHWQVRAQEGCYAQPGHQRTGAHRLSGLHRPDLSGGEAVPVREQPGQHAVPGLLPKRHLLAGRRPPRYGGPQSAAVLRWRVHLHGPHHLGRDPVPGPRGQTRGRELCEALELYLRTVQPDELLLRPGAEPAEPDDRFDPGALGGVFGAAVHHADAHGGLLHHLAGSYLALAYQDVQSYGCRFGPVFDRGHRGGEHALGF
mmetsp:Transcript_3906/g.9353  ORF Transcript_3906/g.9353 Transcript_3906/m.9353 type:complete len:230 (+) Transcript_3906:389-1078(+)